MTKSLSRRQFIKFISGAAFSLAFRGFPIDLAAHGLVHVNGRLGRTTTSLRYYDKPSKSGKELGYYVTDTVIKILEVTVGDAEPRHNPIWYRTEKGWVHSSSVQTVREELNEAVLDIPPEGFVGEVTVPYTQAWIDDNVDVKRAYRFYYSSTHWVSLVSVDSYDNKWYRVVDDLLGGYYFISAKHVRRVPAEELTPISPEVTDKYIQINLATQNLVAYENGRIIFAARISSGTFEGDTPKGEFRVERKQPSRHMAAYEQRGNGFDLPGVPWVSYISWTGVSLHGTYWHNDYGKPRSHGCINLTPAAAKWIYRWTTPVIPPNEDYLEADQGTRVLVV